MSAIAGIVALDGGPVDPAAMETMIRSMGHRGAGTIVTAADRSAAFAWLGATSADGRPTGLPLAFDGLLATGDARIDNREELAGLLQAGEGMQGDVDLLTRLWRSRGAGGLAAAAGDFTLAIWQSDIRRLVCARDHMGIRPLYYHATPSRLFFATELRALLALPEIPRTIDESRIVDFMGSMLERGGTTFYRAVRRLPPAHLLIADAGGVRIERYWDLDPGREIHFPAQSDYDEAFRDIFTTAVRCRFDGGARTGSTLSGGLDSSAISAVARDLAIARGERLRTYSIIFPSIPRSDESSFIDTMVDTGGIDSCRIAGDEIGPLSGMGDSLEYMEEPFGTPNLFLHNAMYLNAKRSGLDSILDGFDGDTTVSHGIAYLSELAHTGNIGVLWSEVSALSRSHGVSRAGILWRRAIKPMIPAPIRGMKRRLRGSGSREIVVVPSEDFARRTGYYGIVEDFRSGMLQPHPTARAHHLQRLRAGLVSYCLEIMDRSSGSIGIEPRYPFFDRRLAEFCLALPGEQKLQGGWMRFIMRNALAGIIPERIRWRADKGNLGHNFIATLLRHERISLLGILQQPGELGSYFDERWLEQVLRRFMAHPTDADAMVVWRVLTLDNWLKKRGSAH